MTRVALVTCTKLPEPDDDEALLVGALSANGVEPEVTAWDDARVDWTRFDLAVIRSTWNYYLARDRFLAWAEATAARTLLCNPVSVLRWNTHKRYLLDLERAGVPIVPTLLVEAKSETTLATLMDGRGYDRVVVKPAVSAGSYMTERFNRMSLAAGERHLAKILTSGDALVQPYLPSVESTGERAIVWIDGELTHSVRKRPRFGVDQESVSAAVALDANLRRFAERTLATLPLDAPLLYARIDVARDEHGELRLMELEVTEPSLFLSKHQPALQRFAAAIVGAATRGSQQRV